MEWLARVYEETSDPRAAYDRLLRADVAGSIVLHVALYVGFVVVLQRFTRISIISPKNATTFAVLLAVIMCLGYVGRLCRAKSIYRYKRITMPNEEMALQFTRQQMNQGYFTWYFLA